MSVEGAGWPWNTLGLNEPATSGRTIRRAYAVKLKALDQNDVAAFQKLRSAYDYALEISQAQQEPQRISTDAHDSSPDVGPPKLKHDATVLTSDEVATETQLDNFTDEPTPHQASFPHSEGDAQIADGGAIDAAITAQAEQLIAAQNFRTDNWTGLFASLPSLSPEATQNLEWMLVQRLNRADVDAQSPEPEKDWIKLLDQHFGWSRDGVGFTRRFGAQQLATDRILSVKPSPPRNPSESIWSLPVVAFISFLFLLFLFQNSGQGSTLASVVKSATFALVSISIIYAIWNFAIWPTLFWVTLISPYLQRVMGRIRRRFARRFSNALRRSALFLTLVLAVTAVHFFTKKDVDDRPKLNRLQPELWIEKQLFGSRGEGVEQRQKLPATAALPRFVSYEDVDDGRGPANSILECTAIFSQELRICVLVMRAEGSFYRAVEIDQGHLGAGVVHQFLNSPRIKLIRTNGGDTNVSSDLQSTSYLTYSQEASRPFASLTSGAPLRFFDSHLVLTTQTLSTGQSLSGADTPLNLQGPLTLLFTWPDIDDITAGISKLCQTRLRRTQGKAELQKAQFQQACQLTGDDVSRWFQRNCPRGETMSECLVLAHSEGRDRVGAASTFQVAFDTPDMKLMRVLFHRFSDPRQHEMLALSQDVSKLRDGLVADYALLLDHPMAEKHRLDKFRLNAAVRRQPQLFHVYRRNWHRRAAVWDQFVLNMERAGFDMRGVQEFDRPASR